MKCIALSLTLIVCCGCGGSGELPDPVPASGTITMDKKPLEGATVIFIPIGLGYGDGAASMTNVDGTYQLINASHNTERGVIPGDYKVIVSLLVTPDGAPIPSDHEEPPAMLAAIESLPSKFSNPGETTLKATVTRVGGTDFDFEVGGSAVGLSNR